MPGPPPAGTPVDPSADPRRRRVRKRPVRVSVAFARAPGTVETLEGPVACRVGDAVVTGVAGERWPVPPATFTARYRPVGSLAPGRDGDYESVPEEAWAVQLEGSEEERRVATPSGAVLAARPGDWVVERGKGDVHVVAGDLFWLLYEAAADEG